MPFTPLHFGPALLIREIFGHKRFSLWAFFVTQLAFDIEPALKMLFDLPGDLHEFTHNPPYAAAVAIIVSVLFWRRDRFVGLFSAVFGVISHLWMDAIYHADVARAIAKWGIAENRNFDVEFFCFVCLYFWLLLAGIKKAVRQRRERAMATRLPRTTNEADSAHRQPQGHENQCVII